jgi:hypothetical protein
MIKENALKEVAFQENCVHSSSLTLSWEWILHFSKHHEIIT